VTTLALSSALADDSDHVVCFRRDGARLRCPDLLALASKVRAHLGGRDERRWALDLDDALEFAGALLGCWQAGKTPVLAPAPLLKQGSIAIDGVIRVMESTETGVPQVALRKLARTPIGLSDIAAESEFVIHTSGSTGAPKEVRRRVVNVEAELAVLESLWGGGLGTCAVHSTVSHRHIYGLLFRVLWPLVTRRPFATFDLEYPEQLSMPGSQAAALVSSPAMLKRIGHLPALFAKWRAVFSSGGLLSAEAAGDARRVLGAAPVEVLGSTETSGVAWRQQVGAATTWHPLPAAETRADVDGHLEVRSPFSGRSGWLQMGDLVRFSADGTFDLLGRGDHLAKIEDKRVSLAEIEQGLMENPWVRDAAAVALADASREYIGVVLQLSEIGASELGRRGPRELNALLREFLRGRIEAVALPRKFRHVEAIPVDAQGKRQPATLRRLFEEK
jgi:acyl-coenzyme A synthetase/AMP-(fatty) acid ligase